MVRWQDESSATEVGFDLLKAKEMSLKLLLSMPRGWSNTLLLLYILEYNAALRTAR